MVPDKDVSAPLSLQKFQTDMMEKFIQFQRESDLRNQSWEQERWRMEQSLMEKWRLERRQHEKEMLSMFCGLLTDFSAALLNNINNK